MSSRPTNAPCPEKNIPNIIDYHLKKGCPILIIFGSVISGTTGHQTTVRYSASPSVCFCTTWGKQNQWNMIVEIDRNTSESIHNIIDCDLKKGWQISIIFGANVITVTFWCSNLWKKSMWLLKNLLNSGNFFCYFVPPIEIDGAGLGSTVNQRPVSFLSHLSPKWPILCRTVR